MKRVCEICGKEFEPYYAAVKTQRICSSEECKREYRKKYWSTHSRAEFVIKKKQEIRTVGCARCRLCGEPIRRTAAINQRASSSRFHEECILKDCAHTYMVTGALMTAQKQRLYTRGYSLKDFYSNKDNIITDHL